MVNAALLVEDKSITGLLTVNSEWLIDTSLGVSVALLRASVVVIVLGVSVVVLEVLKKCGCTLQLW